MADAATDAGSCPAAVGGGDASTATVPMLPGVGSCTPPCGAPLATNAAYLQGTAQGATLFCDPVSRHFTLRNDPENAVAGELTVLLFTFESNQYRYEIANLISSSGFWTAFVENAVYPNGLGYGLEQNRPMRAQVVSPGAGLSAIVRFSFGDRSIAVLEARMPACDSAPQCGCANATDCPAVEAGAVAALSVACADCYHRFQACSAANCSTWCPGEGGNACMRCQTDAGCHTAFMACSGLDYMPPQTLQLPAT